MRFGPDPGRRLRALLKAQVDGVDRLLRLETRSRVLDLGCGDGRFALELARRGHRVLGLDPDERALTLARAQAKGEKLNVHFLKADPRAISYRAEFDAIVCLDGAFGQLPGDREDLRALEAARRALKPNAKLVIDVINREWLMRHFESSARGRGEDGSVVYDHLSFDLEKGRLDGRRLAAGPDGRKTSTFVSARVYALTELLAQAERAGLSFCACWGGFDGSAYGLDSPRLVAVFERPREERAPRRADDGLVTAIRIKGRG
jgi:SAM-dependent methyltransferase